MKAAELLGAGSKSKGLGTRVAEYSERGPFHCKDCIYLKAGFKDEEGKGRCKEAHMRRDPQVRHDSQGLAVVNIEHGCCRFVVPPKKSE